MVFRERLLFGHLEAATFQSRPNRYLAWVSLDGEHVAAHVSDPGRMQELLVPGRRVYVRHAAGNARRKTEYDLVLADCAGALVSINTQVPNQLVKSALEGKRLEPFAEYATVRAEVVRGSSRFDFRLSGRAGECFVEVKSVGRMLDGVGWFPDAVTARGARHMDELSALQAAGARAAVIFVAQRRDLNAVSADPEVDPTFATALRQAIRRGVEAYAFRCAVTLEGIRLDREIPLSAPAVRRSSR